MQFDRSVAEGILFTDQYQLTMAQLYFRTGLHTKRVHFDYFFRKYPDYGMHQAGYCVAAGLEWLLNWMEQVEFREKDLEYMRAQTGTTGERIFADDFLTWLHENGRFDTISMQAVPEGRLVHPNVPIVVVQGPLAIAQILETPLLNHLNYQTLIATKASRVAQRAGDSLLIEFGMRRAPGKAANAGARAALIGGANFSSNAGASHALGYPPKGTHAHSMVQVFMALGEGELGAFRAYADIYPDDCLLLVDTIDTLESGVPNAIRVFEELRKKGHRPLGIRLDSGDLAYLSIKASKMLDEAGFPDVTIFLSNELDEMVIWQITSQIEKSASRYGVDPESVIKRLAYGVGTKLITSEGASALSGVYKLVAVEESPNKWVPALKVSESAAKTLNPGNKAVWRLYDNEGVAMADLLTIRDEEDPHEWDEVILRHPSEPAKYRKVPIEHVSEFEPLLVDTLKDGKRILEEQTIEKARARRKRDLDRTDGGVARLINPHVYHVSLSQRLWELKQEMIEQFTSGER
jgi:nicotinate phosphoribosyltransferase